MQLKKYLDNVRLYVLITQSLSYNLCSSTLKKMCPKEQKLFPETLSRILNIYFSELLQKQIKR